MMSQPSTEVLPGLYVGNIRDSEDKVQLEKNNITHILSIHDRASKVLKDKKYLCVNASDNASQDLKQYFSMCNDFIHNARLNGGGVLIHCLAGVSRSVTLTVAYIMTITDLGWRDSMGVVRAARNCANPNFGFQRQLLAFEHEGLAKERARFAEKWTETAHNDRELCKELLVIHLKWVLEGDNPSAAAERNYPLAHGAYQAKPKNPAPAATCDEAKNCNNDDDDKAGGATKENGSAANPPTTIQGNDNDEVQQVAELSLDRDKLNANEETSSQGGEITTESSPDTSNHDQSTIDQAKIDEFFASSTKL